MFCGAVVGALCVLHLGKAVGLAFALVLLVPVALVAGRLSRPHPAWDAAT